MTYTTKIEMVQVAPVPKVIIAIDQALKISGWCVFKDNEIADIGKFAISPTLPIEERLHSILSHLDNLQEQYEFSSLIFEDIQQQNNAETFKKLAYVQAAILIWCYDRCVKFHILSPSHWRSVIKENCGVSFGRKRAEQKEAAVNFVKEKFPQIKEISSDEADAVCIGYAYLLERNKNKSAFQA